MNNILNKTKIEDFEYFLDNFYNLKTIDKSQAINLAKNAIKYYKGNKIERNSIRRIQDLENQWYKSLKNNKPNYSIYNDPYLISDIFACWVVYSSKYIKDIFSNKSLGAKSIIDDIGEIKSILDLGCGIGYSTISLKENFSKSKVYASNYKDTYQWKSLKKLSKQYDFNLVTNEELFHNKTKIDLVFASEYFEHIQNPLNHLLEIINNLKPKVMIIANSFNTISIGHFNEYKGLNNEIINSKDISRQFNKLLKQNGYTKIKTKLWNSRPNYWRKDE